MIIKTNIEGDTCMSLHQDIYLTNGTDAARMAMEIMNAADVASRIPSKTSMIGIKPNLVLPAPADQGATTHPELVCGVIEYLRERGFENIAILEGAWVGARTDEAFDVCGYSAIAKKYHVELWDTQKSKSHAVDCAGMTLNVCDCVDEVDYLINMPVLKGHCQTSLTCALKNMKGLIPNSEKRRFHSMGLMKPIAHLSAGIHQDFILVDAICGDLDFEEGGNPVQRNQVMGFYDPVLCDAYASRALGYELSDVPYIQMAEKLGIGSADVDSATVHTVTKSKGNETNQKATRRVKRLAMKIDAKDACSACYANLIYALLRIEEAGQLDLIKDPIAIGQAFRGECGKVGVGQCTSGFSCTVKGCPPSAADMVRFLRSNVIG